MTSAKAKWEVFTGMVPILCGAYAFSKNLEAFEYVALAAAIGFGVTIIIVICNLAALQGDNPREVARHIEQIFNRLSWSGLAFILFISAINRFNTVIFNNAELPILEDERCVLGYPVALIDAGSFIFGGLLILLLMIIPNITGWGKGLAARKIVLGNVYRLWIPSFALAFVVLVAFVYNMKVPNASHACQVDSKTSRATSESPSAVTGESDSNSASSPNVSRRSITASDAAADPSKAQPCDCTKPRDNPGTAPTQYDAAVSLIGLLIFFWAYFKKRPTLAQLLIRNFKKVMPDGRNDEGTQKNLRLLVLNLIVLPPIIVGVAQVGEPITQVSVAAFYGIFIYSGFAVWSLSIKIFGERRGIMQTTLLIIIQFLISLLLTALWSTLLSYVESINHATHFHSALVYSLGAILIFINFGAVFATVWEGAIADEWLQQNSKFGILAVLICTMLAGIPQRPLRVSEQLSTPEDFIKPALVVAFSILAILAPVVFSSRSVFAHILIRVQPGETLKVLQTLAERDIAATVTYGEYDIIAKVEIPGRVRIFRKREETGGRELAQLAALVESLCAVGGIVETQTLLDFTGYVRPQPGAKL